MKNIHPVYGAEIKTLNPQIFIVVNGQRLNSYLDICSRWNILLLTTHSMAVSLHRKQIY